ncbi:hypothetical protein [Pedobacter frigidisoli]|uniref:hypothetical protein n=1 Tax=Pedobacter frigidisoli TaxID=2530455 RepID=UPI00293156F0|nr:hypothetical protein [Pedobacter frigidisoli]
MKAFRIILALVVAGATFYSLNVLAMQYGYRDRLDFKNRHYHEYDCKDEHYQNHVHNHHVRKVTDSNVVRVASSIKIR